MQHQKNAQKKSESCLTEKMVKNGTSFGREKEKKESEHKRMDWRTESDWLKQMDSAPKWKKERKKGIQYKEAQTKHIKDKEEKVSMSRT